MKKHLLPLLLCLLFLIGTSQDKRKYNGVIKSAFHIHDTASVYKSSLYAAKILEEVAEEFPEEWLANYWAAYIYTQLSLYPDRPKNAGEIVPINAQKNMTIAMDRYKGDSSRIVSNLHALQSFVYSVHTWYPEFKDEAESYREKSRESGKEALKHNPDNPIMYVLMGISKLSSDKLDDVVAGRALLYRARTLFKEVSEHPAFTMHWNENWLRFRWLKYADTRLAEITN
ncbi:MAG: hypothetical protein ABJP45_00535 [Cyclobacteriaceae bacterium]